MAVPLYPPSRVKVTVPNKFSGNIDTTDRFVKQLSLYFLACNADFLTDQDWIIFALLYMKGGMASMCADQVTEKILEGELPYVNYAMFSRAIKDCFGDPDAGTTVRRKLELVHQGNRSVDKYVSEFQMYASQTRYDETEVNPGNPVFWILSTSCAPPSRLQLTFS